MSEYYSPEQRAFLKDYIKKIIDAPEEQRNALQAQMMVEMQAIMVLSEDGSEPNPEKAMAALQTFFSSMEELSDGQVWFMIHERYGDYNIGLYYDNMNNRAHGEDL